MRYNNSKVYLGRSFQRSSLVESDVEPPGATLYVSLMCADGTNASPINKMYK